MELPRPVALVLSGGASLGALQVGMLTALAAHGVRADLVVSTSVGALNGAVVAEDGDLGQAARRLRRIWEGLRTRDVFPASLPQQALRVLRGQSLHPADGLAALIRRSLRARTFAELRLPLAVTATDARTGHGVVLRDGPLTPALLATTAIPGVFPPVTHQGRVLWDGGVVTNVPLGPAVALGAAALVVLDAGDVCHRAEPPTGAAASFLAAMRITLRQRVLVEAPQVAERLPVLYLPRPCVEDVDPLDLSRSAELIARGAEVARAFLADAPTPAPGRMVGAPHDHPSAA